MTSLRLVALTLAAAGAFVPLLVPNVKTLTDVDRSHFRLVNVFARSATPADTTPTERALVVATSRARRLAQLDRAREARVAARRVLDASTRSGRPAAEIMYELDPAFPARGGAGAAPNRTDSALAELPARLATLGDTIAKLRLRAAAGALGQTRAALLGRAPADWKLGTAFNPDDSRSRGWILLPEALGGDRCATVFGPRQVNLLNYGNPLGPCAWFAAFGPPGAGTKAWLDSTHYLAAVNFAGRTNRAAQFHLVDGTASQLQRERSVMQAFSYEGNVEWVACLAGRPTVCESLLLRRQPPSWGYGLLAGPEPGYLLYWRFANGPPDGGSFFTTVLDDFGAERTAMIWRSSKPLPEAFLLATGQPLDAWMQRAMATYEGVHYRAGPWLQLESLLMLLVLSGGLLFAVLRWGRRPEAAAAGEPMAP
jgi:hypothetical protein